MAAHDMKHVFALMFCLAGLSTPALAQTSGAPATAPPRSLSEPQPAQGNGQSIAPAAAETRQPATDDQIQGQAVVVDSLDTIDGPAVGLLDDTNGSLGTDMWIGAQRADLESELARIPAATPDPVLRDIARRILLTPAETPVGPGHEALITIRLRKLLDAGFIDDAGALAAKAALPNDQRFARIQAEALLAAERDSDLCGDKTATRLASADAFWLQLRTYCYVATGDAAAADLTRAVMTARGADDPLFDALIDELAAGKKDIPTAAVIHASTLDVFLLRKIGAPITARIAEGLGTPANLFALRDTRNSPIDRLACAERIYATGAIGDVALKALAEAQPFDVSAVMQPQASAMPFLRRQFLLRHEAELESRPSARLALIAGADPSLNGGGDEHAFAVLQSDNTASLPADPKAGRDALIAARVLILSGRADAADAWIGAPDSPARAQAGIAIDLAAPDAARDGRAAADLEWLASHADTKAGWPASAALALGLWRALGRPLPADAQALEATLANQSFDGARPAPGEMQRIERAASRADRRGEAALLVLDALGARNLSALAPDASVNLALALVHAGLLDEARALAVELLLEGPPTQTAPLAMPNPLPAPALAP